MTTTYAEWATLAARTPDFHNAACIGRSDLFDWSYHDRDRDQHQTEALALCRLSSITGVPRLAGNPAALPTPERCRRGANRGTARPPPRHLNAPHSPETRPPSRRITVMSYNPETADLDALADTLAALTETQRQAVIAKSGAKDTATKKQAAADRFREYLGGTPTTT